MFLRSLARRRALLATDWSMTRCLADTKLMKVRGLAGLSSLCCVGPGGSSPSLNRSSDSSVWNRSLASEKAGQHRTLMLGENKNGFLGNHVATVQEEETVLFYLFHLLLLFQWLDLKKKIKITNENAGLTNHMKKWNPCSAHTATICFKSRPNSFENLEHRWAKTEYI